MKNGPLQDPFGEPNLALQALDSRQDHLAGNPKEIVFNILGNILFNTKAMLKLEIYFSHPSPFHMLYLASRLMTTSLMLGLEISENTLPEWSATSVIPT